MNNITEGTKRYTVFEIKNNNKKSKNYGRKIYIASASLTPERILSRIRSMQDSSTGKGGTKTLSKDIKASGENYDEKFQVRVIKSDLSHEAAEDVKAKMVEKANKVYNQSIHVA